MPTSPSGDGSPTARSRRPGARGHVHIKLLGRLPVGSGSLGEARLAARYLSKYLGKDLAAAHPAGLHRYEVGQGFQPHGVTLDDPTMDRVLAWAETYMGAPAEWVWRSRDHEDWAGRPRYELIQRSTNTSPSHDISPCLNFKRRSSRTRPTRPVFRSSAAVVAPLGRAQPVSRQPARRCRLSDLYPARGYRAAPLRPCVLERCPRLGPTFQSPTWSRCFVQKRLTRRRSSRAGASRPPRCARWRSRRSQTSFRASVLGRPPTPPSPAARRPRSRAEGSSGQK